MSIISDNAKLQDKLKLIQILFGPHITDVDNNRIDSETVNGMSRAYYIADRYLYGNEWPTKSDLIYINAIIHKLTSILDTDFLLLSTEYVSSKLHRYNSFSYVAFKPSAKWLNTYRKLLHTLNFISDTHTILN